MRYLVVLMLYVIVAQAIFGWYYKTALDHARAQMTAIEELRQACQRPGCRR